MRSISSPWRSEIRSQEFEFLAAQIPFCSLLSKLAMAQMDCLFLSRPPGSDAFRQFHSRGVKLGLSDSRSVIQSSH
jgi:hypothetical protein